MKIGLNVLVYGASSLLSGIVPLLLMPVMTRYLSEADYGAVATVTTVVAIITPLLSWGTTALTSVEYFKRTPEQFPFLFSSSLLIPLISFAAVAALLGAVSPLIAPQIGLSAPWLAATAVVSLVSLPPLYMSTLLRVRGQALRYAAVEIGTAILTVLLTVLAIVGLKMNWTGRIFATALTSVVMSGVAIRWLIRNQYLVRASQKEHLRDAFSFGAGVVGHDIGGQVIRSGDRLLLAALVGLDATGQYAVAASIASIMLVAIAAFNRAWSPFLFVKLASGEAAAHLEIVRMSYLAIAAFLGLFLLFNALTPLLYRIFVDTKFHDSMPYVFWLTLGYFFTAVYTTYVDYIFYLRKTHYLTMITGFNLVCNVTLNYVCVRLFGSLGAAYAFAFTMLLVMSVTFVVVWRLHPMPWLHWRTVLKS